MRDVWTLTPRQLEILTHLAILRGGVLTFDDCERYLEMDRTALRTHIVALRALLSSDVVIESMQRVGYRLKASPLQYADLSLCLKKAS